MKMIKSTAAAVSPEQRDNRIRAMVMGFRERTLSTDDHLELSSWINESVQHEELFEKWIIRDFPRVKYKKGSTYSPYLEEPELTVAQLTRPLIAFGLFIIFCAIAMGVYLLLRS